MLAFKCGFCGKAGFHIDEFDNIVFFRETRNQPISMKINSLLKFPCRSNVKYVVIGVCEDIDVKPMIHPSALQ